LWTLLEDHCKELDFTLATENATSANSFRDGSTASLTKLSQLKVALEADLKYAQVIADLITYTSVAVEDLSNDIFFSSLKVELATTQTRINDMVHFENNNKYQYYLLKCDFIGKRNS